MKNLLILSLFFFSTYYSISQNVLQVQNDVNDQYELEVTYFDVISGNNLTVTFWIQNVTNLQNFNVGVGNAIISFKIRPADCPGQWVNFDYGIDGWDFTNFCIGCKDPVIGYDLASVGYDGKKWIGIKCEDLW